ncbi:MAG TPA: OmpA family protein [Kiloniellales bacterium]
MLRIWRLGIAAGAVFLLAGCQSFIGAFSAEKNLEAAKISGPPAGEFNAALQREYIAVAQTELDEYDFQHADLFARKAIAAANDESIQPEDPGNWTLTKDLAGQFYAARGRLLLALDNDGRTTAPGDAAHAQAMFDCWIEEQELANEGHQPEDIAACRDAFEAALAKVQEAIAEPEPEPMAEEAPPPAPEPPARDYLVYFDFDKTDIRVDAASILDRVVEAMATLGSNSISLTGHADRAGPSEYNQTLSVNRALAVREFLEAKGITTGISTSGKGETDPRVPTPDGVKEQENRRVEIRIN